jgi:ubiquinone biosynthesis protein
MFFLLLIFFLLCSVWILNKIMIFLGIAKDMNIFGKIFCKCLYICGTVYIKLGQMLSNRPDIFTPDILIELKSLQDNVEISSICQTNMDIEFSEKNLIATGTIAQVYKINYQGKSAVIKIKRFGIEKEIKKGFINLKRIANLIKNIIYYLPFLRINILTNYNNINHLLDSFKEILVSQLDFRKEANNIKLFSKYFLENKYILIPTVYKYEKDYIIMEYLEGKRFDLKTRENPIKINNKLFQILIEFNIVSYFGYNLCHGDLHMGNVLLSDDNEIIILDFGIVFHFTDYEINQYVQFVYGIAFLKKKICADILINYCASDNKYCLENYQSFLLDVEENLTKIHQTGDMNAIEILNFATNILYKYKTSLKIPMLNLLLSMIIAEGSIKELSPETNFWKSVQLILKTMSNLQK